GSKGEEPEDQDQHLSCAPPLQLIDEAAAGSAELVWQAGYSGNQRREMMLQARDPLGHHSGCHWGLSQFGRRRSTFRLLLNPGSYRRVLQQLHELLDLCWRRTLRGLRLAIGRGKTSSKAQSEQRQYGGHPSESPPQGGA